MDINKRVWKAGGARQFGLHVAWIGIELNCAILCPAWLIACLKHNSDRKYTLDYELPIRVKPIADWDHIYASISTLNKLPVDRFSHTTLSEMCLKYRYIKIASQINHHCIMRHKNFDLPVHIAKYYRQNEYVNPSIIQVVPRYPFITLTDNPLQNYNR